MDSRSSPVAHPCGEILLEPKKVDETMDDTPKKPDKQDYMEDMGTHYRVLHPTKGWRRVSKKRFKFKD